MDMYMDMGLYGYMNMYFPLIYGHTFSGKTSLRMYMDSHCWDGTRDASRLPHGSRFERPIRFEMLLQGPLLLLLLLGLVAAQ